MTSYYQTALEYVITAFHMSACTAITKNANTSTQNIFNTEPITLAKSAQSITCCHSTTKVTASGNCVRPGKPLTLYKHSFSNRHICPPATSYMGCTSPLAIWTISGFPGAGKNSKFSRSSMSMSCISIILEGS